MVFLYSSTEGGFGSSSWRVLNPASPFQEYLTICSPVFELFWQQSGDSFLVRIVPPVMEYVSPYINYRPT